MLLFGVTIPATVPQRSEVPEGLTNYPVFRITVQVRQGTCKMRCSLGTDVNVEKQYVLHIPSVFL